MDGIVGWLWILPVAALVVTGFRVGLGANASRHRFLLLLIVATAAAIAFGNLAQSVISIRTYSRFWLVAYVAVWSLTALALTEACTRSLEPFERFGRIGQRIINGVFCLSGLIIGGWFLAAPQNLVGQFFSFFQTQGYLAQGSLALMGLSIWTFSRIAGLKLPKSSSRSMIALTTFCCGETLLGSGLSAEWPSWAFYVGIAWTTCCWGALAILWVPQIDAKRVTTPPDPSKVASVLADLEDTNRGLAGLLRRG